MSSSAPADGADLARLYGLETDVGRLMLGIYGKPKPSKQDWRSLSTTPIGAQPRMRELGTRPGARSAAASTINREAIAAVDAARPRPLGPAMPPPTAAVDLLPSRRSAASIAKRESAIARETVSTRPLLRPGRDSSAEKLKLQANFYLRGGKGAGMEAPPLLSADQAIPAYMYGASGATASISASYTSLSQASSPNPQKSATRHD